MLKLARSGDDGEKVLLLVESGARLHTIAVRGCHSRVDTPLVHAVASTPSQAAPPKSDTPSNFTLKLRKHLRTRRLEDVRQLGVDRIIDLQFGKDHAAYHLILEFYASVRWLSYE